MICAVLFLGCESGTEVAGVESATAQRSADGFVTVTVNMMCQLVAGMPRVDGKCDADDDEACVVAAWYAKSDTGFQNRLYSGKTCRELDPVIGAKIAVRSPAPIPTDPPMVISIYALPKADEKPAGIMIDSP
jgi:hypothetical protein